MDWHSEHVVHVPAGALPSEKELAIVPGATHLFEEPGALDEVADLAGSMVLAPSDFGQIGVEVLTVGAWITGPGIICTGP
ncbi:hypothetical protein LB523_25530 [Mesorhizobium sp. ESP-6-4]|uniref:hypothetical protein n=1 Tax=Mesorhizobium sp. ESP-6-4 TaxID=2876624 RepID=UPI001CCB3BAE|nr:hypothetical protein [Mesorhizobium sp. ESP-6-4]MBZ9662417.1 hypothetical protein [Mesorhizobium sp. ESP-6-4]